MSRVIQGVRGWLPGRPDNQGWLGRARGAVWVVGGCRIQESVQGVGAGEGIFECNPGFGALVGQVIRPERRVGYRGLYRGNIRGRGT